MKNLEFYTQKDKLVNVVIAYAQATKSSSGQYKLTIDVKIGDKSFSITTYTNDMPFIDSLELNTDIEAIYNHKESYFEDYINDFIYQNI